MSSKRVFHFMIKKVSRFGHAHTLINFTKEALQSSAGQSPQPATQEHSK